MSFIYVALCDNVPVAVSETTSGIEEMLAKYCGGRIYSYEVHNPKYPDDFQGWYTYEDVDGEGIVFKLYTVDYN